jgi:antitoxin (DNA-binding transcriptional repressor) of toxin-antitoxin stability system
MLQIGLDEARDQLSALCAEAKQGKPTLLTYRKSAVAALVSPSDARLLAALTDEERTALEGRRHA